MLRRFGVVCVWTLAAASQARAQAEIQALTGVIEGHSVGGVTIDLIGNLYVADFGDEVWKITPEGERTVFATGLYGASGNVVDREGNLLQASCYGDSITRIDRQGHAKTFVNSGLSCPIGLAVDRKTGDVFAANCSANSISRITPDGTVSTFAASDLFRCPNGITFDAQGYLYVVNFRDNRMLRVDPAGVVAPFATISRKGLGHVCFKRDRFYVTAYESHEIYEVTLGGSVQRLLGRGERGLVDGSDEVARLSFPNGIACNPWAPRLYINEWVNETSVSLPRRAVVRVIRLGPEP
jgi:DNA-binding beta-propeller fold protein YncE